MFVKSIYKFLYFFSTINKNFNKPKYKMFYIFIYLFFTNLNIEAFWYLYSNVLKSTIKQS